MKTLTIDRNEWYRFAQKEWEHNRRVLGYPSIHSNYEAMLKVKGESKYCCLGMWCRDILGISKSVLSGKAEPADLLTSQRLSKSGKKLLEYFYGFDDIFGETSYAHNERGQILQMLIGVNDRQTCIHPDGSEVRSSRIDWNTVTDEMQEELVKIGMRELGVSVTFIN